MKGHNFFRLIDDMASGRTIATGTQSPFALPSAIKTDGHKFSAEIDWKITLDADAVKINPFTNGQNQRQEIGSYQVTFKPGNGFEGFTSRVSFGTVAESVLNGKNAKFVVKVATGKTADKDGNFPTFFNIEPENPQPFSAELASKVKQALLTIAGEVVPELETA